MIWYYRCISNNRSTRTIIGDNRKVSRISFYNFYFLNANEQTSLGRITARRDMPNGRSYLPRVDVRLAVRQVRHLSHLRKYPQMKFEQSGFVRFAMFTMFRYAAQPVLPLETRHLPFLFFLRCKLLLIIYIHWYTVYFTYSFRISYK